MVLFFFYNQLTNLELIKKINKTFEIYDGYIMIKNYDKENNILEISDKNMYNNTLLYGKMVNFNMTMEDIIAKINQIDECKFKNRNTNYILDTIWANKQTGGVYKANIIY